MSLNKEKLTADLIGIQVKFSQKDKPDFAGFANDLANAIEKFVKSGVVTVQSGIQVSTAGSAASQTGATTSTGTGTIS